MMQSFFRSRFGFFLLALCTGIIVGLVTLVLMQCIFQISHWVFSGRIDTAAAIASGQISDAINTDIDWRLVLAPAVGGLIVGFLLRYLPGQRVQGIADVIEASALRAGKMDVRSGVIAAVSTSVSLGSGAPLGREGPAVHIGASVTSWLAELFGLDRTQSLTLLGCATAAAVTASFNTPLAGVLFSLEVIVGYYALRVFAPVVVAALGAVSVRQGFYGNVPEFALPEYVISSQAEMALFAIMGLTSAVLVQGFIYSVQGVQALWQRTGCHVMWRPAIAGLLVGLVASQYPLILGVGYEGTSLALNQQLPIAVVSALLMAKFISAAIASGSGMAGGVFSPALFMGAMFGGSFWALLNGLIPVDLSSQAVYSIVAMAAVTSAMLGAPISTVLIVFELTLNYELVAAVMLAAALASTAMQYMRFRSFFRWQLGVRGLNINSGRDQSIFRTRTIDDYIHREFLTVRANDLLGSIDRSALGDRRFIAIVVDEDNDFVGSFTADTLLTRMTDGQSLTCREVMSDSRHSMPQSTRLLVALEQLNELDSHYAAVTRTVDGRVEVVGVIFRADVLAALYGMMRQARSEEAGER